MITIISGTNRKDSMTRQVAAAYRDLLIQLNVDCKVLHLDDEDMSVRNERFIAIEQELLIPAQKFIIISPEYNGSYPGILKLMIDNTDVAKSFWNKKVLLTGLSSGRAGNLRGMEHLTGCLLHMKMLVHPNRLPISKIHTLMVDEKFTDAATVASIQLQLNEFIVF